MIRGWLVGDAELVARLEAMPGRLHEGVLRAVTRLCLELEASVKAKLSGEVLRVRTGTLRRSITRRVEDSERAISGIVGTNVAYAAFHEYGFSGSEHVKEHLRRITQAFGRPLKGGAKKITVRAHTRRVEYPPHSFLRTALAEMEGQIKAEIEGAAAESVQE